MYQMVNAFLLLKPSIDTLNVPEFYKLFNSATVEVEKLHPFPFQFYYVNDINDKKCID